MAVSLQPQIATHCYHDVPLSQPCKDCEHEIKHPRARKRAPKPTGAWPV